jgi:hypothetical protein
VDPALRQAYDHFGQSAVAIVRHTQYAPDSLYQKLSRLHHDGNPSEALELLHIILEDIEQEKRMKEWVWNANVEVCMHTNSSQQEGVGGIDWPEVSSTNVSLTASVPMPTKTATTPAPAPSADNSQLQPTSKKPKVQLNIGGQSNLKNGLGSTQGILSANYEPVPQTNIASDLTIGRETLGTSISSATQLDNGTCLSAKINHQYEPGSGKHGRLAFGFSSNRNLAMFHGRTVHAMFALGLGSNFIMNYGVLSLTTWGFTSTGKDESDRPLPRICAKLNLGTQFPIECSIDQNQLFKSPRRSGRASLAWSPLQGYKWSAMLSRKFPRKCSSYHESKFSSNLGIGVEHTGLSGFKWLLKYERPEGLTVRIPIFVSSFLSPGYWNKLIWVSTLSYLFDETIEELMGMGPSSSRLVNPECDASDSSMLISKRLKANEKERQWLNSSMAKEDADRQLSMIVPIAKLKRKREEAVNGLVILKATYSITSSNTSLDVLQQLQFWVEKSRLYLPPSSKRLLLGFYDLCEEISPVCKPTHRWIDLIKVFLSRLGAGVGYCQYESHVEQRQDGRGCINANGGAVTLTVRYKYADYVYETTIEDYDALGLPSRDAIKLGSSDLVS